MAEAGGPRGDIDGRRVAITGGAGFIGSHVAASVAPCAAEVMIVDDLTRGRTEHLATSNGRVRFVRGDIRDERTISEVRSFAPDVVLHLAALHYVPDCIRDPVRTIDVNVRGTERLLRGLLDQNVTSVVLASSAAVYGFSDRPLSERSTIAPVDVYGRSKVLCEAKFAAFYRARPDVRCVAARLFNVFGPNETNPHVIPHIIDEATRSDEIHMGHAWPTRDFVFVSDVARALLLATAADHGFTAYNVGTGVGTSIATLVSAIGRAVGRSLRQRTDPQATRRVDGHLVADPSKISADLNWYPEVTLDEGLRDIVARRMAA
jgi:UDP-glucose 4-epimerase